MSIITLTSDWGLKDHYAAIVKGAIHTRLPEAVIVDISHDISRFNIYEAAFIVKTAYHHFPAGSIHIIGINSEASIDTPHTIVKYSEHYFISADNGIFSLLFEDTPTEIFEINIPLDSDKFTFSSKDVFAKAACHLASGGKIEDITTPKKTIKKFLPLSPATDPASIVGIVMYIDNYENIFTNITETLFKEIAKGRKFSIFIRGHEITEISQAYGDVDICEAVAFFSSSGYLEIALNKANAAGLMGISFKDSVRVEFH